MEKLPRLSGVRLPAFHAELSDRILVADTDLSGVIYFDRYYRRAEAGYQALVRAAGASLRELFAERFVTPAVSSRCDYFHPVTVDELVRQVAFISHTGGSAQASQHHFLNEAGEQLATVEIVRVVIDAESRQKVPIERVLSEASDSHLAKVLRAGIEG